MALSEVRLVLLGDILYMCCTYTHLYMYIIHIEIQYIIIRVYSLVETETQVHVQ